MAPTEQPQTITHDADDHESLMPDFDFVDMCWGFTIAASAGGQLYGLTLLCAGCFVGQKALRRNPAARTWVSTQARALLPDLRGRQHLIAGGEHEASPPHAPLGELPLLDTLDAAPHLLIIGGTRGGKTTLMHELAQRRVRAGARVLVGDPDAARGVWPGCRVYGGGDQFDEIGHMLSQVEREIQRRRGLRAQGTRTFAPLYVVLDEVQDIAREVDGATTIIEAIARRGGKLGVHAVLGVQDKLVATLGWEGKSDLRRNFLIAEVRRDQTTGARVARLDDHSGATPRLLPIPQLPDPEALIVPPTSPTETAPVPSAAPEAASAPTAEPPRTPQTIPPAAPTSATAPPPAVALTATGGGADPLLAALLASVPAAPPAPAAATALHAPNAPEPHGNAVNDAARHSSANQPAAPDHGPNAVQPRTQGSAPSGEPGVRVEHERSRSTTTAATEVAQEGTTETSATPPSSILLTLLGTLGQVGEAEALQRMTERLLALDPSDDELCRLIAALTLQNDRGCGKQAAVETAWGCRKGGGTVWQRASKLWDALKLI